MTTLPVPDLRLCKQSWHAYLRQNCTGHVPDSNGLYSVYANQSTWVLRFEKELGHKFAVKDTLRRMNKELADDKYVWATTYKRIDGYRWWMLVTTLPSEIPNKEQNMTVTEAKTTPRAVRVRDWLLSDGLNELLTREDVVELMGDPEVTVSDVSNAHQVLRKRGQLEEQHTPTGGHGGHRMMYRAVLQTGETPPPAPAAATPTMSSTRQHVTVPADGTRVRLSRQQLDILKVLPSQGSGMATNKVASRVRNVDSKSAAGALRRMRAHELVSIAGKNTVRNLHWLITPKGASIRDKLMPRAEQPEPLLAAPVDSPTVVGAGSVEIDLTKLSDTGIMELARRGLI